MNNEKMNQMNKIKVTSPTFLINLDNPTEVSYEPKEGNWKSIIVSTYLYGFPEIKDNEILYVYKEKRGYIYSLKIEDKPKFKVGDKAWKPKGYKFPCTIVSVFTTIKGEIRLVAEMDEYGLLHIFNEQQLEHYE